MPEPVDGDTLRAAMRRVPSPVTVVTVCGPDDVRGITIGSFTSVSLDPPLICFNVSVEAATHQFLSGASRYAVHILGEEQAHLANHFAIPDLTGTEQFELVSHTVDEHGTPILDEVTTVFHCVPHAAFEAGDHTVFVGKVVSIDNAPDRGAVLYYKQTYRGVGSELRSSLLSPVNRVSSDSS